MSTIGDRVLNISLPKIGEKSLFTRDLEEALRTGGVDFVVHSLKDLPTALPAGMAIGAILERDDARDALVLRKEFNGHTIANLPKGSVIGTSSLRRTAQIRRLYPHLEVCDIRGNLNTRLAKLDAVDSKFTGIVLAQAGLVRMGWLDRISQVLEPVDLLYAVGQGALAVECRANDNEILSMLESLMCLPTTCRILAERSFLKTLGGGCSAPVAVCSSLKDEAKSQQCLSLIGAVWSLDGHTQIRDEISKNFHNDFHKSLEQEEEESLQAPTAKRSRTNFVDDNELSINVSNTSNSSNSYASPVIINDDANMEKMAKNYDMQALLEKHADLAKQCPIVGAAMEDKVDIIAAGDAAHKTDVHCPVAIDVGQDVMGECPFVGKEEKVLAAASGKCPITGKIVPPTELHCPVAIDVGQDVMGECPFVGKEEKVIAAASGKCPITGRVGHDVLDVCQQVAGKCPIKGQLKNRTTSGSEHQGSGDTVTVTLAHDKCPFLQKSNVQMFDYADEEQPQPSQRTNATIKLSAGECEKLDDELFCGFYAHACFNRKIFDCCHRLGQQLAEQLISKGALQVMKCAQNEIHSKIQ